MSTDILLYTEFLLLLLAVGGVGGFLSGLLGVGGGIIFVPALYAFLTVFGVDANHAIRIAIGTSSALIVATSASSAFWHHRKGSIDFSILKSWGIYVVIGVTTGTFFAAYVKGDFLRIFFAGITLFIAFYMAASKEAEESSVLPPHRLSVTLQRMAAAMIGAVSAMIGVGGAILTVPFMTYIGIPLRKAVGTGAALGFVIAVPATVGYILAGLPHSQDLPLYSLGYINLLVAVIIIPLAMLLSPVGVRASHKMPKLLLRRVFAAVMVVVSLRMFMTI